MNSRTAARNDDRGARIREVVYESLRRRAAGEAVSDESVIEAHRDLTPELTGLLRWVGFVEHALATPEPDRQGRAAGECDIGQHSSAANETRTESRGLRVRCPDCHELVGVVGDDPLTDVFCRRCGKRFSLVAEGSSTETCRAGSTVGHFRLIERLGAGAFGTVWKAHDAELHRVVALKIPRRAQFAAGQWEQFLREARAAGGLSHPNIVKVYEVGVDAEIAFIVTEYVDGPSLADRLLGERLTVREAARLCRTIAEALHHAHEAGVVHRDLKPANILLDGAGEPHLTDFGLARDAGQVTMTADGQVLGTPAYIPPEQASGEGHYADARSDVYSLGIILFELVTGELPFRGDSPMLIYQVLHDAPPSPRKLNAHVPRDLETVCLKCLEKDARKRLQTAKEVADELGRILEGRPIRTRPAGRAERAWRWAKRRPMVAGLTCVVMMSVALGVSTSTYFAIQMLHKAAEATAATVQQSELRREAERRADEAETQASVARALRLAAESRASLDDSPQRSVLLSVEAVETAVAHGQAAVAPARQALWDALTIVGGKPLTGHEGPVTCVDVSANGRWIATGSADGTARLWDLSRGTPEEQCKVVRGHNKAVTSAVFTPDSEWLVTGSEDETVGVWPVSAKGPVAAARILPGHTDTVTCLCVDPNGAWLASGSRDGTARLWGLADEDPAGACTVLAGHDQGIACMAVSPDGRWLVTGSYDQTAQLWDLTAQYPGEQPKLLARHGSWITAIAFSADSRSVVIASDDCTARLFDLTAQDASASCVPLGRHTAAVRCVTVSPDNRWVATGSEDHTARLWDLTGEDPGASEVVLRGHTRNVVCLAISPDGRWLVTGSEDGTARLWDLTADDPASSSTVCHGHEAAITSLAVGPNSRALVTGSEDGTARVWSLSPPMTAVSVALRGHSREINGVAFTPDSDRVVTASRDGTARLWDLTGDGPQGDATVLGQHADGVSSMTIGADGRWMATVCGEAAHVWDLGSEDVPTTHRVFRATGGAISAVALMPYNRWLMAAAGRNALRWDLAEGDDGDDPVVFSGHENDILTLAISSDGRWLVTGSYDQTARLWDLTREDPAAAACFVLKGHRHDVKCAAISPDDRWVVTASPDTTARLWDLTGDGPGANPIILEGHASGIVSLAMSPDAHWLATADSRGKVRLWDLQADAPASHPIVLAGHEAAVYGTAFTSDNRRLVTGSYDETVRLWDLDTPDPSAAPLVLRVDSGLIRCVATSPDNRWLAAGTADGTLHLWRNMSLRELIDSARRTAGRELTPRRRTQ